MITLSPAENEIMEVLWKSEGMTNSEIIVYFKNCGKEWKRQTTNTFLTRLMGKGLVTKIGHKYMANYTKQEFERLRTKEILDDMYGGRLTNFIVALNGGRQMTEKEIEELERLVSLGEQE